MSYDRVSSKPQKNDLTIGDESKERSSYGPRSPKLKDIPLPGILAKESSIPPSGFSSKSLPSAAVPPEKPSNRRTGIPPKVLNIPLQAIPSNNTYFSPTSITPTNSTFPALISNGAETKVSNGNIPVTSSSNLKDASDCSELFTRGEGIKSVSNVTVGIGGYDLTDGGTAKITRILKRNSYSFSEQTSKFLPGNLNQIAATGKMHV